MKSLLPSSIIDMFKYCLMAVFMVVTVTGCVVSGQDQNLYNSSLIMAQQGQKRAGLSKYKRIMCKISAR